MRVREVMTREVRSCHASDPLSTAAKIMWELNCGAVPVVDEQGKLVGIDATGPVEDVTERAKDALRSYGG